MDNSVLERRLLMQTKEELNDFEQVEIKMNTDELKKSKGNVEIPNVKLNLDKFLNQQEFISIIRDVIQDISVGGGNYGTN